MRQWEKAKFQIVSSFALLKIDTQPSMKLCSSRGDPINKPWAEQHLTQARGNVAPSPFCMFFRLTSCGNDSREEKANSILHTLYKGRDLVHSHTLIFYSYLKENEHYWFKSYVYSAWAPPITWKKAERESFPVQTLAQNNTDDVKSCLPNATTMFPSKVGRNHWELLWHSFRVHRSQYNWTFSPHSTLVPTCPHLLLHLQEIFLEPSQPHLIVWRAGQKRGSKQGLSLNLGITSFWLCGLGQVT